MSEACGAPSLSRGEFEGYTCVLRLGHEGNHVIAVPKEDAQPPVLSAGSRRRPRPILSERTLHQIRARVALMRWSERIDDENGDPAGGSPVPGSLADVFWNKDIPRLIAAVERGLRRER
jgi:hypothetical protein